MMQYQTQRKTHSGYTLIEVLTSIAVLAILSGVGLSIYALSNTGNQRSNALNKIQTHSSQTLEIMSRSIRSASQATLNNSLTGGNCPSGLTCQELRLYMPAGTVKFVDEDSSCNWLAFLYVPPKTSGLPSTWQNGRIRRYFGGGSCETADTTPMDSLDTDPAKGVSIEGIPLTKIFTADNPANIRSITINADALEGIAKKPATGDDLRTKIHLTTSVTLRSN